MKLKIGELAKLASCPVVTIRFFEKEGLLSPERGSGNYREYREEDIKRLRFIMHCRKYGIKLAEIRLLLSFRDDPSRECATVHKLLEKHLERVRNEVATLQELEGELENLVKFCECGNSGHCSILHSLDEDDNCPYCARLKCRTKGFTCKNVVSNEDGKAEKSGLEKNLIKKVAR